MQQSLEKKLLSLNIILLVGWLRNQLAKQNRMMNWGFQGRCYSVFIKEVALRVRITDFLVTFH